MQLTYSTPSENKFVSYTLWEYSFFLSVKQLSYLLINNTGRDSALLYHILTIIFSELVDMIDQCLN